MVKPTNNKELLCWLGKKQIHTKNNTAPTLVKGSAQLFLALFLA
jgi:hypothetical protein